MNMAAACLVAGVGYLALVHSFRWRRYNAIHAKYGSKIRNLTVEEAQEIFHVAWCWDMPLLCYYSLASALFKTYAIPSISKILVATAEWKALETVSKRYSDTEIMIATWLLCPVNGFATNSVADPRAMLAVARTNWLHSHYNISNDDYLFTLSLFILEPIAWAEKYGWRSLSPLEKQALFIFWVEIGRRMDIKDIPNSLDNLEEWAMSYQMEKMDPCKANKIIADSTMNEVLYPVPNFFGLKQLGRNIIAAALDGDVRTALMMPEPPPYLRTVIDWILSSTAFVQRCFMIPRWKSRTIVPLECPKIQQGQSVRLYPNRHTSKPWYKRESKGLGYLRDRLLVFLGRYADIPGPWLKSEGYVLHAQGPARFEQDGHREVICMAEKLLKYQIPEAWKGPTRTSQCL
ncbi:hypothetical protein F5887DRAFT_108569 [Amanita rubescens]|nr:hypothetical protein F5887DRAFT_108569 [Amanita rubescens]